LREEKGEKRPLSAEENVHSWLRSSSLIPEVKEKIFKFALSALPVFIQGEEGTGRSKVAEAIHFLGPWRGSPFLHFPCHLLTPEKFIERISPWLEGQTAGGKVSFSLYLEDVEGLDGNLQVLLLDLIKNQRIFWPGLKGLSFQIRAISSSAHFLEETVSEKRFRSDLFEILHTLTIALRPLRERKEEIPRLVGEILKEKWALRTFQKKFSPEAIRALQEYDWPRNLPELESLVLRSAALKDGDSLRSEDLIFHTPRGPSRVSSVATEGKESWFDMTLPILAHEIKNPLVAISTFAHLLPEKYEDPEFRQEFFRLVNQDVKRINELLENLLEFTQFSAPRRTPNDLNLVLLGVLGQQEDLPRQRGCQMTTELEEGLPFISFDGTQLRFVLRNLLENACSGMKQNIAPHSSTGVIREEEAEGCREFVELEFWCDGQERIPGKIPTALAMKKEPDFQNTNLALLLIRKVMTRNGGKMEVFQKGEAGTAIRLRFPIAKGDRGSRV
jgi:transcriptional regulator with AAA-type ATPase domain